MVTSGMLCLRYVLYVLTAQTYEHLGCFTDRSPSSEYDLQGKEVTLMTLTVAECVEKCRMNGYPYAGLQEGEKCFCGDMYGQYGLVSGQ